MNRPLKVSCCYDHADKQFLSKLLTHMKLLERQELITLWKDTDISAGTNWREQIKAALNTAQIILLLVSPDFIASDFCYENEMTLAMERHKRKEAHVIPIILRPSEWQKEPLLSSLEVLPADGLPITRWSDEDDALLNIVVGIRKVVEELSDSSQKKEKNSFFGTMPSNHSSDGKEEVPSTYGSSSFEALRELSPAQEPLTSSAQPAALTIATSSSPATSPSLKKWRRLLTIIGQVVGGIATLIFVLGYIGGCIWFYGWGVPADRSQKERDVLQGYCAAMKGQDYRQAYGYFIAQGGIDAQGSVDGRGMTLTDYIGEARAIDQQKGKVTDCSLDTSPADLKDAPYGNSQVDVLAAKIVRGNRSYVVYFQIEPYSQTHVETTILDVSSF